MPRSVFGERSEAVLAALLMGVSVADAARAHEVGERTIESWLAKGRRDPDGRYGDFARQVDAAREERRLPTGDAPDELTEEEIRQLLTVRARAGSIPAIKLFLEKFVRVEEPLQARESEAASILAAMDEVAARRAQRGT